MLGQQVADRTEDADGILGLDISGLDMSHPTLGMSESQLRLFLLKRQAQHLCDLTLLSDAAGV